MQLETELYTKIDFTFTKLSRKILYLWKIIII